jgi:hypothetical protein
MIGKTAAQIRRPHDGIKLAHDELSWLQRFTPRRPRSGWSKINTRHAQRLDTPDKVNGKAQFGLDVRLPGIRGRRRFAGLWDSFS